LDVINLQERLDQQLQQRQVRSQLTLNGTAPACGLQCTGLARLLATA
jgi:hypothetical protein